MVHLVQYLYLVPTLLTSHLTGIAGLLTNFYIIYYINVLVDATSNSDEIRERTIKQWLSGDTRAKIASDNSIGEGSVTNIVSDFNKGLADSEFESIREVAVESRKQGLTISELGSSLRLYNYIKKLGANQDRMESLMTNLSHFAKPEKVMDIANQVAQLSRSESIPLQDLEHHVRQKEQEKQRLEQEIEHKRVILKSTNEDVQTINEYKQLKDELSKHRLSIEDPPRLLSILRTIKQIGYDPQKIVARFSYIKSLRQTEKDLKIIAKCSKNEWPDVKEYYH